MIDTLEETSKKSHKEPVGVFVFITWIDIDFAFFQRKKISNKKNTHTN